MLERIFLWYFNKFLKENYDLEYLINEPGNEMWRLGKGYNVYRWFARLDWGSKGWRLTEKKDYCAEYFKEVYPKLNELNQNTCDQLMAELIAESQRDNSIVCQSVARFGQICLERTDLFPRLYSLGRDLLSKQ